MEYMDIGGALDIQNNQDVMPTHNIVSPPKRRNGGWIPRNTRDQIESLRKDRHEAVRFTQENARAGRIAAKRIRNAHRQMAGLQAKALRFTQRTGTRNYTFKPKRQVRFHKQTYIKPTNYIHKRYKKSVFKAKAKYGPYDAGWYHGGRAPYEGYSQGTFIF